MIKIASCISLALMTFAMTANAQSWPTRPIRLVTASGPGGNPDVMARLIAPKLFELLKQPIVVDNAPGSGGVVAAVKVTSAPADGYTLLLGDSAIMAVNPALYKTLPYNALKDLRPITSLVSVPTVLVVNPSVHANTWQEFAALVRAKPGEIAYASAGQGSIHHLTMAILASQANLNMLHVPYKGGAALVAGVMGGEVQAGWSGIPTVLGNIQAGKLRALAISGMKRTSSLPNVPTIAESGVPGFDVASVVGLQAPAGTPTVIIERLQHAFAVALREPETQKKLAELGMDISEKGTDDYLKFVQIDFARYATAAKAAGIEPQ